MYEKPLTAGSTAVTDKELAAQREAESAELTYQKQYENALKGDPKTSFDTEENYLRFLEDTAPRGGTTARTRYMAKKDWRASMDVHNQDKIRQGMEEAIFQGVEAGKISEDEIPARLEAMERLIAQEGLEAASGRQMGDPLLQQVAGGVDMEAISGYLNGTVDWTGVNRAQGEYNTEYKRLTAANKELSDTQTRSLDQASELLSRQNKQFEMMRSINRDSAEVVRTSIGSAVDELNTHVLNPYRIYQNGFAAIGSAIAVAIGAYAQGLSGGNLDNTALRILENAEKRDLEAQKSQYQAAKDKIGLANNLYKQMMDQFGNEEDAMAAAQLTTRTYFQNEIKKREIAAKDKVTSAAAALVRERLDVGNEVIRARLESNLQAHKMSAAATLIRQSKAKAAPASGETMQVAQMNLDKIGNFIKKNQNISWNDYINMKTRASFPFLNTVGQSIGVFDKERTRQFAGLALPMVSTVFMVAQLNDPAARITDNDYKIFAQSTFTPEDFKDGTATAKLAEAQKLVNKLSEMRTLGVSYKTKYGSLAGMIQAESGMFPLLSTPNSMDSVASTLPGVGG